MLSDLITLWPLALLVILTTILTERAVKAGWIRYWISRKILHVVAVGSCAIAPFWVADTLSLIAVVLPAWLLLIGLVASKKLMQDEQGRPAWGIVWFPLAYLLLLAFYRGQGPHFIAYPMLILAICDPLATIFGKLFGRRPYRLTGEPKTLVGNVAFFLSSLLLSYFYFPGVTALFDGFTLIAFLATLAFSLTVCEALGSYGLDNLYLPIAAFFHQLCWHKYGLDYQPWLYVLPAVPFVIWAARRGSLTRSGGITAALLGASIGLAHGPVFLLPLFAFFGSSTLIGKLLPHHTTAGDAKQQQPRDAVQVLANGGVFWLLGLIWLGIEVLSDFNSEDEGRSAILEEFANVASSLNSSNILFPGLMLISIAISTADTWASEVGQYFQHSTYDLLRLKAVQPGLSGGVSISGTLAGWLGASLIASLGFLLLPDFTWSGFTLITGAGFCGMIVDSLLGSYFQRQYFDGTNWRDTPGQRLISTRGVSWISNDAVNLLANVVVVTLLFLIAQLGEF